MKKILPVLIVAFLCATYVFAQTQQPAKTVQSKPATTTQQKPTTTQQKPATQGAVTKTVAPPPYLLKKDFEVKMQEITPMINSAVNANAGLKKEISRKLEKLDTLNMRMQNVEDILSSANFKISTTSDSLKSTQFSMDEYKKRTETNIKDLQSANTRSEYLWILGALAILSILIILVIMNVRMRHAKDEMQKQAELMRAKIKEEAERQHQEVRGELASLKVKLQNDLNAVKAQIIEKVNADNHNTSAQLKQLMDKLNEQKKV